MKTNTFTFNRLPIVLFFSLLLAVLTGCSVQKQIVTQGKTIDSESINQLKLGMDRAQVRLILGSPAIIDTFDSNQWIYYFSRARITENKASKTGNVTLTFKDNALEKIVNDGSLVVKSSDENLQGGTVITKPTQKKRGIFNRL
ncbi:MAG: outer membrane protein assembly factor BamE [Arenicella sp.]